MPQPLARDAHAMTNFTSGRGTHRCFSLWRPGRAARAATPRWPSSRPSSRHPPRRGPVEQHPAFSPPAAASPPQLSHPRRGPGPHLQLPGGHAGRQLDDTAHRHACRPGRVQLVPNGVTVHLSKQPAPGGRQGREERGREGEGEHERKQTREGGLAA